MKILLDENLPVRLKLQFPTIYSVFTVHDLQWQGKKDGELMGLLVENHFDLLITADQNLYYQQNLEKYNFPVFILKSNHYTYDSFVKLMPKILLALNDLPIRKSRGVTMISGY